MTSCLGDMSGGGASEEPPGCLFTRPHLELWDTRPPRTPGSSSLLDQLAACPLPLDLCPVVWLVVSVLLLPAGAS